MSFCTIFLGLGRFRTSGADQGQDKAAELKAREGKHSAWDNLIPLKDGFFGDQLARWTPSLPDRFHNLIAACESRFMAQTVSILLGNEDRKRLDAIVCDRSRPLKHVQQAKIVLHSAERFPALEVARRSGVSRPAVWHWQQHYAKEGVDGLLRDKTRKPGRAPLSQKGVAKV